MKACKLFLIIPFCFSLSLYACTDFLLKTEDGACINGRSMEFGIDLRPKIVFHPRGEKCVSKTPANTKGLAWSSQYAYLGVTVLGLDAAVDGMNERGLSFAALWAEGSEYEKINSNDHKKAVVLQDFGNWILGNCATVQEVKEKLATCKIWGEAIEVLGKIPPLHFAIHDVLANSLVIECEKGIKKIYDNKVAVLTDVDNSKNQARASRFNQFHSLTDWNPSKRFTKIALFKEIVKSPLTAKDGVLLAFHFLNTVDKPKTQNEESSCENRLDHTQWVVVKDLKNRQFYFRMYEDASIQSVDFKMLLAKKNHVKK